MASGCATNQGPNEQRKRWMAAGLAMASGIVLAFAAEPGSVLPRIGIALSIVVAAVCLMQARSQTCVLLAYTGRRNLDGGNERVRDLDQRHELVRSANLVMVKALALALAGMLVLALV
jgi:hypothetical protein